MNFGAAIEHRDKAMWVMSMTYTDYEMLTLCSELILLQHHPITRLAGNYQEQAKRAWLAKFCSDQQVYKVRAIVV